MTTINRGTKEERALREAIKSVSIKGHRIDFPKAVSGNFSGTCRTCNRAILIRFDVPCEYMVTGAAASQGCPHATGF